MKASKKVRRLSLGEWVREYGISKTAKTLGVHRTTVCYWLTGHCYPRVKQMIRIKALSKGSVSYQAMIEGGR